MEAAQRSTRSAWVIGVVAVVLGLLVGVVAVLVLGPDDSSAAAVTLVRADEPGDDPFTDSVATTAVPTVQPASSATTADAVRDEATAVLVSTGTAPGLYGGSGDVHVCDADKLVDYLHAHDDKAAAWSSVLGIAPEAIDDYVAALTPVVLLSDTVVTNHGFENGKATASTSVLQSGTAVMVDAQGVPRVKCNCGNPLTPPQVVPASDWHVQGEAWDGYDAASVTGVAAGDEVTELVLRDVETGEQYTVPVGSGSTPPHEASTSTTVAAAGADLAAVDWYNRTYQLDEFCPGPQFTLQAGGFEDAANFVGVRLVDVLYGDLTGDGLNEAVLKFECYSIGGNAYPATPVVVFTSDASGPVQLGAPFEGQDATIVGDAVQTTDPVWGDDDPRCCPSSTVTSMWRYRGGAWVS